MVFPATILFASYHLKASGLSLSKPSNFICSIPLKNSFAPVTTFVMLIIFIFNYNALSKRRFHSVYNGS